MRIRGEGCGCVRGREAVQHCEAIFHCTEEHRRVQAAAHGVAGNITLGDVEEMYGTASRVAGNATDALSRCCPLPRTFAQPRPGVQGARACEQDVANERAVLVHTTVEDIRSSFPDMSEWARVSMDMCGKSVNAPADIVPRCETCNTAVDYCSSLVEEFESSVSRSDSERERLGTELGGVFELIAAAEKRLEEAGEVVEKERQTRAGEERARIDEEEAEMMEACLEEAKGEAVRAASEERAPAEAGSSPAEHTELVVSDLLGEEDENGMQVDVAPGNAGKKWNSKTMLVVTVVPVVVVLGAGSAWFVRQRAHTAKKVASL
ncbi:hypothetical protein, conserved in T. vivax [Trypanosoma vivax Y486]|uniref:Uncharacterized protein n=1 Tax=Trypanosoma vivax (strain Y486) TaxID=1055687 RepID=F9WNE5_TRYVY|nr:hypothetical protein, conserved in T. vivax [Trypanosoma vivax Y486]|eukprot:CCD19063.1 hypothetical protein, conserved in T. vivax [Trypanosoma vivax Y486]